MAQALGRNLMVIFNAGVPAHFQQYYRATMAFLSDLEALTGTQKGVAALRAHPAYVEFFARWHQRQLPVYYQVRFREISSAVEEGLGRSEIAKRAPTTPGAPIASALERAWHDDVVLYGLVHRFWKLTFQVGCGRTRRVCVPSNTLADHAQAASSPHPPPWSGSSAVAGPVRDLAGHDGCPHSDTIA